MSGLIKHYHAWFEITDQKTTFAEAQAYCANRGLTLARMDTEIVADEVVDFIGESSPEEGMFLTVLYVPD